MIDNQLIETKVAKMLQQIQEIAADKNISQTQIAERTGLKQSSISRMLSGKFPPQIDNLLLIGEAVGFQIEIVKS